MSAELSRAQASQAVCDEILLGPCSSDILNIAQVMDRGPGSEQQLLHRDEDLSVPVEKIKAMPNRPQALLGYAAHDAIVDGGGYLGTVDLVDPMSLLK